MPAANTAKLSDFVHLHVHSHFSILDSAATTRSIVETARLHHMSAVALTDHNSLSGVLSFFDFATKNGIKPIIGLEASLARDPDCCNQPPYHILLLALNQKGFHNLLQLSTLSFTKKFATGPRINFELLERFSEGLIALSGCLDGEVPQLLLSGQERNAEAAIKKYQQIFGRENFYVELQNHGLEKQKQILPDLVKVARTCNCPIVATNNVHYIMPQDCEIQAAMLCEADRENIGDTSPLRFAGSEFYFKSEDEMKKIFASYPEAITNSLKIAQRCSLNLSARQILIPEFHDETGKKSAVCLKSFCEKGLKNLYKTVAGREEAGRRLEYELSIITKQGLCDLFLLIHDLLNAARTMNVPANLVRGNAACSLVNFLLGITDLDPLKYGLIFEMLVDPAIIRLPDIYIGCCGEKRQQVIDYVTQKYGRARIAKIASFVRFDAHTAIMAAGRASKIPTSQTKRIADLTKNSPHFPCIDAVFKETAQLKDIAVNGSSAEKMLLRIAVGLKGQIRKRETDPCALVISPIELHELVPLAIDNDGSQLIQYESSEIANSGLLEINLIGLDMLSIIQRTCENIQNSSGKNINLKKLPLTDRLTYELLQKGITSGIPELESGMARKLIISLKPVAFEDIILFHAMFRAAPLSCGLADELIQRKSGQKEFTYPHPLLEAILSESKGLYVYHEQHIYTAVILAGFTLSQANAMRKTLAKKIVSKLKEIRAEFLKGAAQKGISEKSAISVFDLMENTCEFSFSKANATTLALLSFRSAYLKAHFPNEFNAATLSIKYGVTEPNGV